MRSRVGLFWAASALSSGSTWVLQVAVFVLVVQRESAGALAFVELAGSVPALALVPLAGALADRWDPRVLAIGSLGGQVVCVLGVAVALRGSVGWVAVAYGAQGVASCLWAPARQVWMYAVLPAGERQRANAALGSVSGLMTIVGAALGGVLAAWSPVAAVLVAAAVQLLSVLPAAGLARVPLAPVMVSVRRSLRAQLTQGLAAVTGIPLARSVVWIGISWGFVGGAYNILLAGFAVRIGHGGGPALGGLYVVDGVGVLIGAAIGARIAVRRHIACYAVAYLLQGLFWAAMFLVPSVFGGGALLLVMRVASGVIIALDTTILLASVPEELRGRVTGLHATTYSAMSRLSLAVFGGLLTTLGIGAVGVGTGLASAAMGLVWWSTQRRGAQQRYLASSPR